MNDSDCYSAMSRVVTKIYSELVALRLLYTLMPITKFGKKVESDRLSRSVTYSLGSIFSSLKVLQTMLKYGECL